MADPVSSATFTVTYDETNRRYAFVPSSQAVLTGGTVTLVAVSETTIQALLSSDNTAYQPLGGPSNEYVAKPSPGRVYTLATTDTGYLTVKGATTNPAATIVPVVKMSFSSAFSPAASSVSQGGWVQLVWTGSETEVSVKTYKADGTTPFSLFGVGGGPDGNAYTVQPRGTSFTVPTTVEAPGSYIIEYISNRDPHAPVRGTVNVTVKR